MAPEDLTGDLRRRLSSLEYEIVAAVGSVAETEGVTADVAVLWEPDREAVGQARERGLKTVALGGDGADADLSLASEEAGELKSRVWELFRPA